MLDNPGFFVLLIMTIISVFTAYQQREKLLEQYNKMDKGMQNLTRNIIIGVGIIDLVVLIFFLFN